MTLTLEDPRVVAALSERLAHDPPFATEELASVAELYVQGAQDLSALRGCTGLRSLSLMGCAGEDLNFLSAMNRLTSLRIVALPLRDISALADLSTLQELELLFTYIADISPLVKLDALGRLHLDGSPLSDSSFRDTLSTLQARVPDLQGPAEAYWQACRQLYDAGSGVVIGQLGGPPFVVRPGVPKRNGADCDFIDKVHRGMVRTELKRLGDAPERLFDVLLANAQAQRIVPTTLPSEQRIQFGAAERALGWVEESGLASGVAASLRSLIRRFPDQTFQRRKLGGLGSVERRHSVALPPWLHEFHQAFDGFRSQDVRAVRFAAFDHPLPAASDPKRSWYTIGFLGADNDDERALIDRDRLFPIAKRSPTGNSTLAIRLDDPADQRVYELDEEGIARTAGLKTALRVAFDSYARMWGAIDAVRLDGDVVVEAVDD